MKSCPKCDRLYDESLSFCLEDGAALLPVGPDADAETVFRNADPQPRRSNLWKYAFLILVPLLLAGFVAALFISQKINGSRELGGTQNAPGNSANTALVNTATNANANKENQNVNSSNTNSAPDLKPAPQKRKDKPKFADYPATESAPNRNAPLVLSTARDRTFKTFLKENATKPPNFAGHYILATTGCGTQCATAALIDASKGLVYWFPETINPIDMNDTGDDPLIKFRSDSKLIIFPTIKESESTDYGYLRHYVFENNRFYLVYSVKQAASF